MGKVSFEEIGRHFGKPDLERFGLFVEMPYMNGKGYVSPFPKPSYVKGLNMMAEGRKSKNATQAGYFDKEFRRLFKGECLPGRGRKPPKPIGKNVSARPMMPAGYPKKHSCPGDYFGCFSGRIEAFGTLKRKEPPRKKQPPNFLTNPGKKGGTGYANITLAKYPEHSADRFGQKMKVKQYGSILDGPMRTMHWPQPYFQENPYLDPKGKPGPTYAPKKEKSHPFRPPGIIIPVGPSKWQGGCHAGCFDKFPTYKPDKYISMWEANKPRSSHGLYFFPQSMGLKTMNTCSVLNRKVDIAVNVQNYKTYEPTYVKHLL